MHFEIVWSARLERKTVDYSEMKNIFVVSSLKKETEKSIVQQERNCKDKRFVERRRRSQKYL